MFAYASIRHYRCLSELRSAMRELKSKEINAVSGGFRAITISIAANLIYDGLKAAGGAMNEHYSRQSTAIRDNPSGRGRALL